MDILTFAFAGIGGDARQGYGKTRPTEDAESMPFLMRFFDNGIDDASDRCRHFELEVVRFVELVRSQSMIREYPCVEIESDLRVG